MTESTAACGNGDAAFEPSSVLRLHAARSRPDPATSCLLPAARVGLGRPAGRVPGRGPAPHAIAETVSARACSFRVFSRIALAARVTHACLRVQSAVPLEARPIFPLTGCLVPKIARALVLFSMHVHGGRGASCGRLAYWLAVGATRYGLGASVRLAVRPKERERERKPRGSSSFRGTRRPDFHLSFGFERDFLSFEGRGIAIIRRSVSDCRANRSMRLPKMSHASLSHNRGTAAVTNTRQARP